jgi:hypothetical protein
MEKKIPARTVSAAPRGSQAELHDHIPDFVKAGNMHMNAISAVPANPWPGLQ